MAELEPLKIQNKYLTSIKESFENDFDVSAKLKILQNEKNVAEFLKTEHPLAKSYHKFDELEQLAIVSVIVIGQSNNVFRLPEKNTNINQSLNTLVKQLSSFEKFYLEIGGIIGYHLKILELIFQKQASIDLSHHKTIHQAEGVALHEDEEAADRAVVEGIKSLHLMGELYPIGGAGDRLNLRDEKTGLALPTAKLNYLGHSLLTNMICDLQAREYIYYKVFNKQILTPVAMMTSAAKSNHQFILQICNEHHWYHRPQESFRLFEQPLAPVVTVEGQWAMSQPLELFLKPSGHGVIWKLARDEGIFDWFEDQKRPKALLRQMNNPIAGTDNGILALIGLGCSNQKSFGFASCQRLVNAAEGVNVLAEQKVTDQYRYCVTNIEYTEFDKYHLKDEPYSANSPYSIFPSNTNILFIDFKAVIQALNQCTIPGMLINMKSKVPYFDENGEKKEMHGGRLESTMQNIADYIQDTFDEPQEMSAQLQLKTFLTYNQRRKTISVAKKTYQGDGQINETPEGCYYHLQQNNHELLTRYCSLTLSPFISQHEYVHNGPLHHILIHPALGPLYSIINQKIKGGKLADYAELNLHISELNMRNFALKGSCVINAENPMGHLDDQNILQYSNLSGKCYFENVSIENEGIDYSVKNTFWKNQVYRKECFELILEENAEFHAKDISFIGSYQIRVPKNTRMIASMDNSGKVCFEQHSISKPSWYWHYTITDQNRVILTLKK